VAGGARGRSRGGGRGIGTTIDGSASGVGPLITGGVVTGPSPGC